MRLRLPFNQTPFLWALLLGFSYLLKLIFGISLPLITFDLVAISWLITSMWVALSDEYSSYIESSKNAFWLVSIITFIVVFPYFIFRVFLNSFYAVKARYVKIVKVVKKYIPYCKYFFPFCYSVLLVFWEVFIELLLFFTLCLTEFVTNFVKFLSKILSYAPGSDSYSTWYVTIILLLIFMLVNPIYFLLSGTLLRAFWYIIEECGYLRDFRLLIFIFIFVLSIAGYSPTYYCITSFTEWSLECIDTLEDALTSLKDILHLQLLRDNIPAIVQYKLSVMLHDSIPTHIEYKPLPLSWHWDIPHWYEGLTKLFYTYHNICGPLGVTYTDNMSNWNRYFVWALTGIKYWEGFDDLPAQVPAALEAEVALTWEDTFLDFDWHFADEQLLASVSNKLFGLFKEPIHPSNWNICPCDDLFSKFRTYRECNIPLDIIYKAAKKIVENQDWIIGGSGLSLDKRAFPSYFIDTLGDFSSIAETPLLEIVNVYCHMNYEPWNVTETTILARHIEDPFRIYEFVYNSDFNRFFAWGTTSHDQCFDKSNWVSPYTFFKPRVGVIYNHGSHIINQINIDYHIHGDINPNNTITFRNNILFNKLMNGTYGYDFNRSPIREWREQGVFG